MIISLQTKNWPCIDTHWETNLNAPPKVHIENLLTERRYRNQMMKSKRTKMKQETVLAIPWIARWGSFLKNTKEELNDVAVKWFGKNCYLVYQFCLCTMDIDYDSLRVTTSYPSKMISKVHLTGCCRGKPWTKHENVLSNSPEVFAISDSIKANT